MFSELPLHRYKRSALLVQPKGFSSVLLFSFWVSPLLTEEGRKIANWSVSLLWVLNLFRQGWRAKSAVNQPGTDNLLWWESHSVFVKLWFAILLNDRFLKDSIVTFKRRDFYPDQQACVYRILRQL